MNTTEKLKTRIRVIDLLRREQQTVDQLARVLGVTDNAVRMHLEALEREGVVRQVGVRRSGTAGKPATLFEVTPEAETSYSRVYAPVLSTLIGTLADRFSARELEAVLRETGRRLGGLQSPDAELMERARAASALLNQLGALTTVHSANGSGVVLRGATCPLAVAVAAHHEVCMAVEELVSALVGTKAQRQCVYSPKPACRFLLPPD